MDTWAWSTYRNAELATAALERRIAGVEEQVFDAMADRLRVAGGASALAGPEHTVAHPTDPL
jgi:hypothetical protein